MNTLLLSSVVEGADEKRLRVPWMKKSTPLKGSMLFSKAKHREEWHQNVEATAGVLHPSDSKFPYGFVRNHTEVYLRKKGKISQADTDIRLAILVESHEARDIGVAAIAHAMSAKSLRELLHVELNVAQGSYWGLGTWLQCLIAANYGNPASVTDLEALWARMLLPYATHGRCAAELFLRGVSAALRNSITPSMNVLPEFFALVRRAIKDCSTTLDGFRLRNQWVAAHKAVFWMVKLAETSPVVAPPGHLLPEHIFDSQFPTWRLWAEWRPNVNRITLLSSLNDTDLATIPDIVCLEGPDVLTYRQGTLREGLIAQYTSERPWIRFGKLVVEVPECTKAGIRCTLERLGRCLETIPTGRPSDPVRKSMIRLFRTITISQPVTQAGLDLFEATLRIPYTPNNDIYNTVREIYVERNNIGGQHILTLQKLICLLGEPQAEDLRKILIHPWLLRGLERCINECQVAVQTHVDRSLSWIHLASELHALYATIKASRSTLSPTSPDIMRQLERLPSPEHMAAIVEIYETLQAQKLKPSKAPQQHANARVILTTDSPIKQDPTLKDLPRHLQKMKHPLEGVIEQFCVHRLLESGVLDPAVQQSIDAILNVWENTCGPQVDNDRRSLSILVAKTTDGDDALRCRCLNEIALGNRVGEPSDFIEHLLAILIQKDLQPEQAIIEFTKLLAKSKAWTQCWKDLLYIWLEPGRGSTALMSVDVLKYSLESMKVADWLAFMYSLETIFIDLTISDTEKRTMPLILQPQLFNWKTQVSRFTSTLTRLENALSNHNALQCILVCGEGLWTKNVISILEWLERAEGKPAEPLMQQVAGKLSTKTNNAWEVKDCLFHLLNATLDTIQACERVWDAKYGFIDIPCFSVKAPTEESPVTLKRSRIERALSIQATGDPQPKFIDLQPDQVSLSDPNLTPRSRVNVPSSVAEVMVAGWLQDDSTEGAKRSAIESIACLLNLEVFKHAIPTDKMLEATNFWENIEKEIIREADRLEALQKALKVKDPKGTTLLLQELGISENSLLDEEIMALPAEIMDVVERVGENEVEISFSLTSYTDLRRAAVGVPKAANTLLLRLSVNYSGDIPPSFCVHFNNDLNLGIIEHSPWICSQSSKSPKEVVCKSTPTAFLWQLNRIVHTRLIIGNNRISDLHTFVKKRIDELGHSCISCGASHNASNAQLRRSTPCDVVSCSRLWYQLPLEVRIPEIRTDTFAIDVMLTAVYAAAMSNKPELLPGCPIYGSEVVKAILNSLPSLTVLRNDVNLSTVLKSYHKDAEKLISWACVHFRGYLATATGICKIPNLPAGTHQFVLVNASPRLENEFVSSLSKHSLKTMVLFHGTSLDRLPAILAQGLKVCSGTSLQRTGAAHGKGIYMAEDPATSFSYSPASLSWRNSSLPNMRLMLGCEVAGNGRSVSSGIHVITDEKTVMVRYIFLFPNHATSPVANHIIPAMRSSMSALRVGSV